MTFICFICCEESMYFTAGECEHKATCLKCSIKLRKLANNFKCVVCNIQLKQVVVLNNEKQTYLEARHLMEEFEDGICYHDSSTQGALVFLNKFKCSEKGCQCTEYFKYIENYKKHLSRDHSKFLCDLCVQNEVLLMNEHKTFTAEELKNHLEIGSFDEDNNLVSIHPLCKFCNKNFFNDEALKTHLQKSHEKCPICKDEKNKWVFYKDCPAVQKHFKKYHILCQHPVCKDLPYQVFKNQSELGQHLKKQHGIYQEDKRRLIDSNEKSQEVRDNDGTDFQTMFLSERKKKQNDINETEEKAMYLEPINYVYLFKHLYQRNHIGIDQEKEIISNLNEYEKFNKKQYIETVAFNYPSNQGSYTVNQFLKQIKEILNKESFESLNKVLNSFQIKKDFETEFLLFQFQDHFGAQLYIKYVYLFSLGIVGKKKQLLQEEIKNALRNLSFKSNSFIQRITTWKTFYHFFSDQIAEHIIERIQNGRINLDKKYVLHQDKILQLVSACKRLSLEEAVHFDYLQNFLMDSESLKKLQNSLLCSESEVQSIFSQINSIDILIVFIYLNLIILCFEDKSKIKQCQKLNPNLLKIFLRYYPDLAQDLHMDLESDTEDYNYQSKQLINIFKEESQDQNQQQNPQRAELVANKINFEKNEKVFKSENPNVNVENRFDFPEMNLEAQTTERTKKINQANSNLNIKKADLIKEFPELVVSNDQSTKTRIESNYSQSKSQWQQLTQQIQSQNDNIQQSQQNQQSQSIQNTRSIFNNNQSTENDIQIVTKKKKKKLK